MSPLGRSAFNQPRREAQGSPLGAARGWRRRHPIPPQLSGGPASRPSALSCPAGAALAPRGRGSAAPSPPLIPPGRPSAGADPSLSLPSFPPVPPSPPDLPRSPVAPPYRHVLPYSAAAAAAENYNFQDAPRRPSVSPPAAAPPRFSRRRWARPRIGNDKGRRR